MELSINSWHSKLYNIFYTKGLPQSLCPYFWKLVLAIVLFIPMTLWYLIMIISSRIIEGSDYDFPVYFNKENLKISWLVNGALFIILILVWIFAYSEFKLLLYWIICSVVTSLITFLFRKIFKKKPKKEKVIKIKRPTILQEFIKAKYNKYCPKINWQ